MKTTDAIKGALPMVAVWFATHCGGGFATGNQEVNFYVKYGWYSLILPIFAMTLVGWGYRNALIIAKEFKAYNYRDFSNALFKPHEKKFSWVFEIGFILLAFTAISASIAAAGSLLEQAFGVPYFMGIAGVGLMLVIMTLFGGELIIKVLSFKTVFLIATLFIVCLIGVYKGADGIKLAFDTKETFGHTFAEATFDSVIYVGFQIFALVPFIAVSQKITSDKECNWFMLFGVLLNGGFLLFICAMLLAFAPETLSQKLPVYFVGSEKLSIAWLKATYSFILFVALVGTVLSMVFGLVARFELVLKDKGIYAQSVKMRRGIVSTIVLIIGTFISTAGLTAIVVKGYGSLGYVGVIFILIPVLWVGTKVRRQNGYTW